MDPHGTCIGYLQINKVKVAVAEQHVLLNVWYLLRELFVLELEKRRLPLLNVFQLHTAKDSVPLLAFSQEGHHFAAFSWENLNQCLEPTSEFTSTIFNPSEFESQHKSTYIASHIGISQALWVFWGLYMSSLKDSGKRRLSMAVVFA